MKVIERMLKKRVMCQLMAYSLGFMPGKGTTDAVVRLPRPMEQKGVTPVFSSLQKLAIPPQSLEQLIVVLFPYIILVF